MLFILFRGREYAIEMVLWARILLFRLFRGRIYMYYSDCSVAVHMLFKLFVGVPVQFKLYLCARLFYSNCSAGVPVYYSDCSLDVHMLFKLFRGRVCEIQIVPLCSSVLFKLFCGRSCVLFRLFCRRTYAIQIVPWACLCNSNCTFVHACSIQIVPRVCLCTIQIVPWAYTCYSNCSVGVSVKFKLYLCGRLFYSNCSVGTRVYYSDCSVGVQMLFKLFSGPACAIQIVPLCAPVLFKLFPWARVCTYQIVPWARLIFKLFFGRAYVIPIVPLCVPIQIVP